MTQSSACLNCGEETTVKCFKCENAFCQTHLLFTDEEGHRICMVDCPGPDPKCGICGEIIGEKQSIDCERCTSLLHKDCSTKKKRKHCKKCLGKIKAVPTDNFEKSL